LEELSINDNYRSLSGYQIYPLLEMKWLCFC